MVGRRAKARHGRGVPRSARLRALPRTRGRAFPVRRGRHPRFDRRPARQCRGGRSPDPDRFGSPDRILVPPDDGYRPFRDRIRGDRGRGLGRDRAGLPWRKGWASRRRRFPDRCRAALPATARKMPDIPWPGSPPWSRRMSPRPIPTRTATRRPTWSPTSTAGSASFRRRSRRSSSSTTRSICRSSRSRTSLPSTARSTTRRWSSSPPGFR